MAKRFCFLSLFCLTIATAGAQGLFEVNAVGAVAMPGAQQAIGGIGGGGAFYYNLATVLKPLKKDAQRLGLYVGGDGMIASMGQRNFEQMEMQNGPSKVQFQNSLYNFNAGIRVSYNCFGGKLQPYAGLYAGYRCFNSEMNVYPNDEDRETSNTRLAAVRGINTGISAGVIIGLSKDHSVCLNAGVDLNHSRVPGCFVDLSKLERQTNGIGYSTRPAIDDYMIIKVGITALLDFKAYQHPSVRGCSASHIVTGIRTIFHPDEHYEYDDYR